MPGRTGLSRWGSVLMRTLASSKDLRGRQAASLAGDSDDIADQLRNVLIEVLLLKSFRQL
jgi:hypothetical protein